MSADAPKYVEKLSKDESARQVHKYKFENREFIVGHERDADGVRGLTVEVIDDSGRSRAVSFERSDTPAGRLVRALGLKT